MPVFGIALFGLSQFTMTTTLKDIRQRIGLNGFFADTVVSAATSLGTTTTLIDTAHKQPDDWWNGGVILILTGDNAGQVRYITDWVQSTSTFTLDRALSAAVASGVQYEIHRLSHPYDKNNAANEAIRAAALRWARRIEDTTLTFATNTFTYSLDSLTVEMDTNLGIDYVMYDTGATGTGVPYALYDDDAWTIRTSASTHTLQVQDVPRNGATMRLVYRVRPSQLQSDSDLLLPQDESFYNYVVSKATAILFRQRAGVDPSSDWSEKAERMEAMAEGFFNLDKPQSHGGKIRFPSVVQMGGDYLPVNYGL
jgi:hypothetical protein